MKTIKKKKSPDNEVTKGIQDVKSAIKENELLIPNEDFDFKQPTSLNEKLTEILDKNPKHFYGCG